MAGLQLLKLSIYLVLSVLIVLSNAGCGTYTSPSGNKYNLEPLTKSTDYTGSETANPYSYNYNYCQNIKSGTTQCITAAPVVQISNTGTCTPTGLLPQTITEVAKNQLKLVYTNNQDLCGNPRTIPRVSTFNLACSSTEYSLAKIEEPGVCQYEFTVNTKYACAEGSTPPSPGGKGSSMTGGVIFLIIFFVALALYFLVGVVVKWRVYSASGVELIPNTELWLGLPGLIRDGFLFVKNKLTGAVGYSSL